MCSGLCLRHLFYTHTFNGLFSSTAWVSRHQKGKPFWILLKQEMMGWQWHQLDHMQIICTTLQTDNHASIPSLNFLRAGCSSRRPTNNVKALKAITSRFTSEEWPHSDLSFSFAPGIRKEGFRVIMYTSIYKMTRNPSFRMPGVKLKLRSEWGHSSAKMQKSRMLHK